MLFNFYLGTNKCHRSYLKHHDEDAKHKAAIARYLLNQYPSTPAQLEECITRAKYRMSVEMENEFNIIFNSSYWIAKEGLACNPVTKFLGIQHLEHAHTDGTLTAIEKVVYNHLGNTDTMYQEGVNCNFDGASVMPGYQGGVHTKMQEKQPAMPFTHCIAHKLELA